ncbi:hypothetical protein FRC09_003811 [Ceratobasidium sp. 395]|nr:hypothetical protein FRC09_003811 [Ceratobasidium sp. 395]
MEAVDRWVAAQSDITEAVDGFLDARLTLRNATAQSFPLNPNHTVSKRVLDGVQSHMGCIDVEESYMHESRTVINALLNSDPVPVNKLPPEILGRIFSIVVASSPCTPKNGERDTLLDIPLVCTRWHQLATSDRFLWSHIDIDSGHRYGCFRLNRIRLWLERSRGASIYIHSTRNDSQGDKPVIPRLISILQPHAMFTSSLVISGRHIGLTRALLALCLNQSGPGTLNTLILANDWSYKSNVPWPTYSMRALVALELRNIRSLGTRAPVLEQLVDILSDCPKLHTLRLIHLWNFSMRSDQPPSQGAIFVPHLRLLELVLPPREEALVGLMTAIKPGELELDVRLGIGAMDKGSVLRSTQLLLSRSNVVSLTLLNFGSPSVDQFRSLFSSMPYLRGLRVNSCSASLLLSALANDTLAQSLSNLQSLCILEGGVNTPLLNRIISFVKSRPLRSLFFWSCRFPLLYNEGEGAGNGDDEDLDVMEDEDEYNDAHSNQADDGYDDEDDGADGDQDFVLESPLHHVNVPDRARTLLLGYVERIVVCETPSASIVHGVDVSVQEMIKID